jgi:hypothetical protein
MDLEALGTVVRRAVRAEHLVPLYALVFMRAGTLPKTSSGKIQRHTTRERFLGDELDVIRCWMFPTVLARDSVFLPTTSKELPGAEEIRDWLLEQVARHANVPLEQIDPTEPLNRNVQDSVSVVALATELQLWLGRPLSPMLVHDTPSIQLLAGRLADSQSYPTEGTLSPQAVDEMAPSEVDEALARLLAEGR